MPHLHVISAEILPNIERILQFSGDISALNCGKIQKYKKISLFQILLIQKVKGFYHFRNVSVTISSPFHLTIRKNHEMVTENMKVSLCFYENAEQKPVTTGTNCLPTQMFLN